MVRVIEGDDGRKKLQLRIDMGLLQMETSGRPDGLRPEDYESWLDYYEHQQQVHDRENPDSAAYQLSEEACSRLWREGVQYYHRYLGFWHLEQYEFCARDTARNLRLFAFVGEHVRDEKARFQFDQWRPYVTMMHSRAVAMPLLGKGEVGEAIRVIESAIGAIKDFLEQYEAVDRSDECSELVSLEQWRDEILLESSAKADVESESVLDVLRRRLQEAVADEAFEEAARLRDEIRRHSESSG